MDEKYLEWMELSWEERLVTGEQECQAAGVAQEDRIWRHGRDFSAGVGLPPRCGGRVGG